jgi:hypothetical protein
MHLTRRNAVVSLAASCLVMAAGRSFAAGAAAVKALKPGEFIWRPEVSPRGPVVIVVSLPEQLVHVYRNGVAIGVSTCSTGKLAYGIFWADEHYRDDVRAPNRHDRA